MMEYSFRIFILTIVGRINEVLPEIPVYFSNIAKQIITNVFCFSKTKGKFTRNTTDLKDGVSVIIKDIKVTPYVVDYSAYNAYMLLVETEGKKILFSGDFRNHSYKGKLLQKTLKNIGKVDICICEGTTFSRPKEEHQMTEQELVDEIIKQTKLYSNILCLTSTTNVDRIVTLQKVANRTHRTFIHDLLLEQVLKAVTQKIPNALNSNKIYVYMPTYLYWLRNKAEYRQFIEPYESRMKLTGRKLRERKLYNECPRIYVKRYRETKAKK